jgi:hypothetical protein
VRRFRPIVLTAAAAVLAMIPLSRSVFWGPMAVAIMGGLIVATALTLLALPAMYAAWFRVRRETAAQAKIPVCHERGRCCGPKMLGSPTPKPRVAGIPPSPRGWRNW